ncbi:CpsB/CapC family capsule biosynthesis tyrosine phosphatase [Ruminococcus sp.]|uniref:CpsB/CapC family capsule biosynthesis tyrosine phosphatase n=1 Tax=Ruminococcus sp. TaxID=41978 RepID=UPI0025D94C02|nr:CpsB/CapC family capsule biosynthesis tyrosine phosphatase [Ruminococcus sp.]
MLTDYHCHILPFMDDGAADLETALEMIEIMKEQGVERIIATPHFYAHEERSLTEYLLRREDALDSIWDTAAIPDIVLGAEVAIEHGISKIQGIEQLAIENSDMLLLELPYRDYEEWMSEEINAVSSELGLKVILAHVHRYLQYYSPENIEKLLKIDAIFQFNNDVFLIPEEEDFLEKVLKSDKKVVFGSDAHNTESRRPNWNMLIEKCDSEILRASNELLEPASLIVTAQNI